MLTLDLSVEPHLLDLLRGVRVKMRPVTTAVMAAAQAAAARRLAAIRIADPDLDPDMARGLSFTFLVKALARQAVLAWDSVGDAAGKPLPLSPEAVERMDQNGRSGKDGSARGHGQGDPAFAEVGIVGLDGRIELEALRLFGLPEAALSACPSVPVATRGLALETSWDLPSLGPGATTSTDVTVAGARRGDITDASLDTSSIAFVLDCHVWLNDSVRVAARNVSAGANQSRIDNKTSSPTDRRPR